MGLKRWSRRKLVQAFGALPFHVIQKMARSPVLFPYYHIVGDEPVAHVRHLYNYKTFGQFEGDLEFLLAHYRPLSLDDFLGTLENGEPPREPSFLMSFDDGYREMHDTVAPMLRARGVPAVFFLNPPTLDNRFMVYLNKISILIDALGSSPAADKEAERRLAGIGIQKKLLRRSFKAVGYAQREIADELAEILDVDFEAYLSKHEPYLTVRQVQSLINDGFAIGGHSLDHPRFGDLALEDQLRQAGESVKRLRETFSLGYSVLSFPHSDTGVSAEFFSRLYGDRVLDASFGTESLFDDPVRRHFQRTWAEGRRIVPLREKILGAYAARISRRLLSRHEIVRN